MARTRAGVLGSPIAHSLSPVLHRAAYVSLGLDWRYDAVDVDAERLGPFLAALGPEWAGLSLTMPLKEAVLDLLDSASDLVDLVGAANTVLLGPRGRHGENTDVAGIVAALESIGAPHGRPGLVLGAGGTARAALAALVQMGSPHVTVAARRPHLAEGLLQVGAALGVEVTLTAWPESTLPGRDQAALVVAAVPARATYSLVDLISREPGWLLDVSYDPWPSRLAGRWLRAGGQAVGGAEMLIAQAAEQVRLMTGGEPDVSAMRRALAAALAERAEGSQPA